MAISRIEFALSLAIRSELKLENMLLFLIGVVMMDCSDYDYHESERGDLHDYVGVGEHTCEHEALRWNCIVKPVEVRVRVVSVTDPCSGHHVYDHDDYDHDVYDHDVYDHHVYDHDPVATCVIVMLGLDIAGTG